MQNEGITNDINRGFIFCLLASKRPFQEMLNPNLSDQHSVLLDHFMGMTKEKFDYQDYERVRLTMIQTLNNKLTKTDKDFLLSFANTDPDWQIYNFEAFPAVQWKLKNLKKLKNTNHEKHGQQLEVLKSILK